MSADTFTTAMFLITAVLAAGVLINAVFPVVYNMAGTFSTSTHESDLRIRTDFKIITTFANTARDGKIWMKNVGSTRISMDEIRKSDAFFGPVDTFSRMTYSASPPGDNEWYPVLYDLTGGTPDYWDKGETLEIQVKTSQVLASGDMVYFQFILPNGVWRSIEYTVS